MRSMIGGGTLDRMTERAAQTPPGSIVEVGVYQGGSAARLAEVAREQGRKLYLYDTFTGIPYAGEFDNHKSGDFDDTDADRVRKAIPDACIVEGIFPETMVDMGPIAFVHLDCDQYRSYVEAITALLPHMVEDGVMWFDDYDCLPGANRAIHEFWPVEELDTTGCKAYRIITRDDINHARLLIQERIACGD